MGFNDLRKKIASVTPNGGQAVEIKSPLSTFGELTITNMVPVAQGDFVYDNINTQIFTTSSYGAGTSVAVSSGMCNLDSGTDASGSATIQLRRGLKYRSGQGALMRGTALFSEPDAGHAQFIGFGNAECGYFIGYFGNYFGVLHQPKNRREIRKLTVTTATATGNVTVTLDGNAVTVPVNATTTNQLAYQLFKHDYRQVAGGGFLVDVIGSDVYFITARSRQAPGVFNATFSGSPIGTFSIVQPAIVTSPDFIPSGSFNIDKLDGTGPSQMILDPTKGNVFQIGFQYLGFGNAKFYVENPQSGHMQLFHEIQNANNRNTPVLVNPNVSILATSANIGGTTSKRLKSASLAAFNEGIERKLDPKYSRTLAIPAGDESTYVPLAVFKTNRVFGNQSCFGEFDLLEASIANNTASSAPKSIIVGLFLNATITGDVDFQEVSTGESIVSYADTDPTIDTIDNVANLVPFYTITCGAGASNTQNLSDLNFAFGPGQTLVVAYKTSGNISASTVSINWYEQQ